MPMAVWVIAFAESLAVLRVAQLRVVQAMGGGKFERLAETKHGKLSAMNAVMLKRADRQANRFQHGREPAGMERFEYSNREGPGR